MRLLNKTLHATAFLLLLSLTLTQPVPAFALRQPNPKDSPPLEQKIRAGLEEGPLQILDVRPASESILTVTFSPDGKTLAWASGTKTGGTDTTTTIHLRNLADGGTRSIPTEHTGSVKQLRFSPDGRYLVSLDHDGVLFLWETQEILSSVGAKPIGRQKLVDPLGGVEVFWKFAFSPIGSPIGNRIAAGTTSGRVLLFSVTETGLKEVGRLQANEKNEELGLDWWIEGIAFSPDGRTLTGAAGSGIIVQWDLKSGSLVKVLEHRVRGLYAMALSPDGKTLATADDWNEIQLWDLESGQIKQRLQHHWDNVSVLTFSPDGRLLASGGKDSALRVTNLATQKPTEVLNIDTIPILDGGGFIKEAAFSPDGKTLAVASGHVSSKFMVWTWQVGAKVRREPQVWKQEMELYRTYSASSSYVRQSLWTQLVAYLWRELEETSELQDLEANRKAFFDGFIKIPDDWKLASGVLTWMRGEESFKPFAVTFEAQLPRDIAAGLEEPVLEPFGDSLLEDPEDLPQIEDLMGQFGRYFPAEIAPGLSELKGPYRDSQFSFVMRHPASGQIIALASASRVPEESQDTLFLSWFMVDELFRRQGIGRRLLEAVFDAGRQASFRKVLWRTPVGNTEAQEFYRRIPGVKSTGEEMGVLLDRYVRFEKSLSSTDQNPPLTRSGLEEWEPFVRNVGRAGNILEDSTGQVHAEGVRRLRRDESLYLPGNSSPDHSRLISDDGLVFFRSQGDGLLIQLTDGQTHESLRIEEGAHPDRLERFLTLSVHGRPLFEWEDIKKKGDELQGAEWWEGKATIRRITYRYDKEHPESDEAELILWLDPRVGPIAPGQPWKQQFVASPVVKGKGYRPKTIWVTLRTEPEPSPLRWAGDLPLVQTVTGDRQPLMLGLDLHAPNLAPNDLKESLELILITQDSNGKREIPIPKERMEFLGGRHGPWGNNDRLRFPLPEELRDDLERTGYLRYWFRYRLRDELEWRSTSPLESPLESNGQGIGEIIHHPDWLFNSAVYGTNAKSWRDFDALRERLPDIERLGAKIILLQGIHPGDTAFEIDDYEGVDDRLGGKQAFLRLIRVGKELGFRFFIPFVPGHASPKNKWIQQHPGRFYRVERPDEFAPDRTVSVQVNGKQTTFLRGNVYKDWPHRPPGEIEGGFGPGTVQANLWDPTALKEMADEWERVLGEWVSLGIDGFWTDTGHSIHYVAPGWLEGIQSRVRMKHPGTVFGYEAHWLEAGGFMLRGASFAQEHELYFKFLKEMAYGRMTAAWLLGYLQRFPMWFLQRQWIFLENHDEERFAYHLELSGMPEALRAEAHRAYAALLMLGIPGIPLLNGGEEIGDTQRWMVTGNTWNYDDAMKKDQNSAQLERTRFDPFADQSPQANEMRESISRLLALRSGNPAFWWAEGTRFLPPDGSNDPHLFVSYRAAGNHRALVIIRLDHTDSDPNHRSDVWVDLSFLGLSAEELKRANLALKKKPSLVLPAADSSKWRFLREKKEGDVERGKGVFLKLPMAPFQTVVLEWEAPAPPAQTTLTAAGLEESRKEFPRPRKTTRPHATEIWPDGARGAGEVVPSLKDPFARIAVMAPNGGPAQHLRVFAWLKIDPLPEALFKTYHDEKGETKSLIDWLPPPEKKQEAGYLYHPNVPPEVRLDIERILMGDKAFPQKVVARYGDQEVELRPINVWKGVEGRVNFEGWVPATEVMDLPLTVEVFSNQRWYRLPDEGRVRIEGPNAGQVASTASWEELEVGKKDARREMAIAEAHVHHTFPIGMQEGYLNMIQRGIVTDNVLPRDGRTPLLKGLLRKGYSHADIVRIFMAQQLEAGVQKSDSFRGIQTKLFVLRDGQPVQVVHRPERSDLPQKLGEGIEPFSDLRPIVLRNPDGKSQEALHQRTLPPFGDSRLKRRLKSKAHIFPYVLGHRVLMTEEQVAQADWNEEVEALDEETWRQAPRRTVIGFNIGAKSGTARTDWVHGHDVPLLLPMDEASNEEILWMRMEDGVRIGKLRRPELTTYVVEGREATRPKMKEMVGKILSSLKGPRGLTDYNLWGFVREDGVGRYFITPRNPRNPKSSQDSGKPLADQDYWRVEVQPGQFQLMNKQSLEDSGLKPMSMFPFVRENEPVLDIKFALMEVRGYVIAPTLDLYEDPYLEAKLDLAYRLVGLPWEDHRIYELDQELSRSRPKEGAAIGLSRAAQEGVQKTVERMMNLTRSTELRDLLLEISGPDWGMQEMEAFQRLDPHVRNRFTQRAEELITQFLQGAEGVFVQAPVLGPAEGGPGAESNVKPKVGRQVGLSLNPTWDRTVRFKQREDGSLYVEVEGAVGGYPANMARATDRLGEKNQLVVAVSGETGKKVESFLKDLGVEVKTVSGGAEPTRVSLIVEPFLTGEKRMFVAQGGELPEQTLEEMKRAIAEAVEKAKKEAGAAELTIGERRVPPQTPDQLGDLIRDAQSSEVPVWVGASRGWDRPDWNRVLGAEPLVLRTTLIGFAQLLRIDPDRLRARPQEIAFRVDAIREHHSGIKEFLISLGTAGEVVVTEEGRWQVIPPPVLHRRTYVTGTADVVLAAYRIARHRGHSPPEAMRFGVTAGMLYAESGGKVPSFQEVEGARYRTRVYPLPRAIPGGTPRRISQLLQKARLKAAEFELPTDRETIRSFGDGLDPLDRALKHSIAHRFEHAVRMMERAIHEVVYQQRRIREILGPLPQEPSEDLNLYLRGLEHYFALTSGSGRSYLAWLKEFRGELTELLKELQVLAQIPVQPPEPLGRWKEPISSTEKLLVPPTPADVLPPTAEVILPQEPPVEPVSGLPPSSQVPEDLREVLVIPVKKMLGTDALRDLWKWKEESLQFPGGIYLWMEKDGRSVTDFFERSDSEYIGWLKERGAGAPLALHLAGFPGLYLLQGTSKRVADYLNRKMGKVRIQIPKGQGGQLKGDLEKMDTVVGEQPDIWLSLFAQGVKPGNVRMVLGPSAFRVEGLATVVELLAHTPLGERLVVLPHWDTPFMEFYARMSDLVSELQRVKDLSVIGYADEGDRSMKLFIDRLGLKNKPELRRPQELTSFVRQLLLDLGVPEGVATQEAVQNFLSAAGLEQAA